MHEETRYLQNLRYFLEFNTINIFSKKVCKKILKFFRISIEDSEEPGVVNITLDVNEEDKNRGPSVSNHSDVTHMVYI